jgi:predicted N-acyltransferase
LKTKIFTRIEDIPVDLWNSLLPDKSLAFSHEFWRVVEKSEMNDFDYRYVLLLDDNDSPAALTCFYSITTDIAIFAPLALRKALLSVRRYFPNFLKFRMIEWGTPITVSSPPFVTRSDVSPSAVIAHMHQLLMTTAKSEGHFLIVVRDFEGESVALQSDFSSHGYHLVDSLPNTGLDVAWPTVATYHAAMKSYYRSKLLKHLRRNLEHQVRHELVDDFDHLADTLCTQWLVVHNQADEFQREVLTPTFYREFSRNMGSDSKALLFYKGDELVGHALLLLDGPMLRWLYFGRNEATNDSLYLYVAHSVIETSILLGAKTIEMGLTTYAIKLDLGARVRPIKIALRAVSGFINLFVGLGYATLNRPPSIQARAVFKPGTADAP